MSDRDITNLPPQDPMLAFIERAARDPTFSVEKVEALLRLQVEQQKRVALREFIFDQNAMQEEMTRVHKSKPNPAFNSKYATLEALDKVARPIWTKYGFGVSFGTAPPAVPGNVQVTCRLAHRGGHWEEHALEGPISTDGSQGRRTGATPIQAVGSAVTYLRRYLLQLVLNLVATDDPEDNDGNAINRDPHADWVDRFEQAAEALTDSDGADALMNRDTVLAQTRSMPPGPQRDRFMQLRQEVTQKWLRTASPPVPEAPTQDA